MKGIAAFVLLIAAVAVSACGTFNTRSPHRPVGADPFAAVWTDGLMVGQMFSGQVAFRSFYMSGVEVGLLGIVSLPVDLVLDAVFLPVDLLGWAFGARKDMDPPWLK